MTEETPEATFQPVSAQEAARDYQEERFVALGHAVALQVARIRTQWPYDGDLYELADELAAYLRDGSRPQ